MNIKWNTVIAAGLGYMIFKVIDAQFGITNRLMGS